MKFQNLLYRPREKWWHKILLLPLWGVSVIFRLIVRFRNRRYERGRVKSFYVGCPVISVGALTAGGSGKTTAAMWIAEALCRAGRRVAILSRGHGGRRMQRGGVVSDFIGLRLSADEGGDEPYMMARRLPGVMTCCGRDRLASAQMAISEYGVDTLVLDDGFQHRRLARDLDILVFDSAAPLGNGYLLPRGPLREPLSSLNRADIILVRGNEELPFSFRGESFRLHYVISDITDLAMVQSMGKNALMGLKVVLFAGIARPEAFADTLRKAGAEVVAQAVYPDHHLFTARELVDLQELALRVGADCIATTEKDAVRIDRQWERIPMRVVRIDVDIERPEALSALLLAVKAKKRERPSTRGRGPAA